MTDPDDPNEFHKNCTFALGEKLPNGRTRVVCLDHGDRLTMASTFGEPYWDGPTWQVVGDDTGTIQPLGDPEEKQ